MTLMCIYDVWGMVFSYLSSGKTMVCVSNILIAVGDSGDLSPFEAKWQC